MKRQHSILLGFAITLGLLGCPYQEIPSCEPPKLSQASPLRACWRTERLPILALQSAIRIGDRVVVAAETHLPPPTVATSNGVGVATQVGPTKLYWVDADGGSSLSYDLNETPAFDSPTVRAELWGGEGPTVWALVTESIYGSNNTTLLPRWVVVGARLLHFDAAGGLLSNTPLYTQDGSREVPVSLSLLPGPRVLLQVGPQARLLGPSGEALAVAEEAASFIVHGERLVTYAPGRVEVLTGTSARPLELPTPDFSAEVLQPLDDGGLLSFGRSSTVALTARYDVDGRLVESLALTTFRRFSSNPFVLWGEGWGRFDSTGQYMGLDLRDFDDPQAPLEDHSPEANAVLGPNQELIMFGSRGWDNRVGWGGTMAATWFSAVDAQGEKPTTYRLGQHECGVNMQDFGATSGGALMSMQADHRVVGLEGGIPVWQAFYDPMEPMHFLDRGLVRLVGGALERQDDQCP